MRSLMTLFLTITCLVNLAYAPPPSIVLCWIGDRLTTTCDNETTIPDGTEISVCLDWNHNGYSPGDFVMATFDFHWESQGYPGFYCADAVDLEADLFYLRASLPEYCWVSEEFQVEGNSTRFELYEWTCYPWSCLTPPPHDAVVLRFAGCLMNLGCPCEYPMSLPPGTAVELLADWTTDGPSPDDSVASSFELATGSGLPPWDGLWTPLPAGETRTGSFYVQVRSDACCWVSEYVSLSAADTVTVPDSAWACAPGCLQYPCAGPPVAPQDFWVDYSNEMVRLRWYYEVDTQNFAVYMDDAELMVIPGFVRLWSYYASPGLHSFYLVAKNICGNSEPSESDTVWVPGAAPRVIGKSAPARPALAISPNPFNATTTISFVLTERNPTQLVLFDMLGRSVATLTNGDYEAGEHRLTFDGTDLATGLYFARLVAGHDIQTRKLLLLK